MNTMHLLEQIQKLWPDKLNDEQGKAVADATARLELTTEQVTAVCRSVWSESASKTPLQVRLIDRLKDAANPLRNVRAGTVRDTKRGPGFWYRQALAGPAAKLDDIDKDVVGMSEETRDDVNRDVVWNYHGSLCAKDVKCYGLVRPTTVCDAWADMSRLFGRDEAERWVRHFISGRVADEWIEHFDNRAAKSRGAKQRAMSG